MFISLGASSSFPTERWRLVSFLVWEYILNYGSSLHSHWFASIPIDGHPRFVYKSRFGVNWATKVRVWIKRWAHWSGRGAALRLDSVVFLPDTPFNHYIKDLRYVSLLAAITVRYADLGDEAFITNNLNYVALPGPYDRHYLLKPWNTGQKRRSSSVVYD